MKRLLYICIIPSLSGFSILAQEESLKYYANQRDKYIGAAVNGIFYTMDTSYRYVQVLRDEFNMVVAENEMKFYSIHPANGEFNFNYADQLVQFAEEYDKEIRGHCLIWHSQLPTWINTGTFTRDSLLEIMENHITTIVSRYKGKIREWDVVNEAVDVGTNDDLRRTIWYNVIGPEYIDSAFIYAHRADTGALLFYIDYGAEGLGTKSDAVYNLVSGMLERDIPIHGVALHSHFTMGSINASQVEQNIQRLGELGLLANITELDIKIPVSQFNDASYYQQALDYSKLMEVCLNNNNCTSFVLWGFTDRYSWIPEHTDEKYGKALIFDKYYLPKQAYYSLLDTLAGQDIPRDCNGDLGGTASIDDCKKCSGGNTGIEPNSTCVMDEIYNVNLPGNKPFILYPNPVKDKINIRVMYDNIPANVEIVSLLGKKIYQGYIYCSEFEINTGFIPAGIYIMNIISEKGIKFSQLFIKQLNTIIN